MLVGVSVLDDLPAIGLLLIATATSGLRLGGQGGGWIGPLVGVLMAILSWVAVDYWARHRSERPTSSLSVMMMLIGSAWLGESSGLTSLLGALWGGVLMARLGPVHGEVQRVLNVLSEVFLPLYFISVGMRVAAGTLLEPLAWSLAAVLIVMGVLSKLTCGLGITRRDREEGVDRWLVVAGLIPRGLPGLVFATTALNQGLINSVQFSALVMMVTVTTVLGLLLLERRLSRVEPAPA